MSWAWKCFITSGTGCFTLICSSCHVTVNVLCLFLAVPWVGLWSVISKAKIQRKIAIFFLSISWNIFCGCSKKPSHWDGSFEHPQHMFWLRNKNIIFRYTLLSGGLCDCGISWSYTLAFYQNKLANEEFKYTDPHFQLKMFQECYFN